MGETEYMVSIPVDELPVGYKFGPGTGNPRPLQCSLFGWFKLPRSTDPYFGMLDDELRSAAHEVVPSPIALISDVPALFDPGASVPVHTLVQNERINNLHTKLFYHLRRQGIVPGRMEWAGDDYRPHVTTIGKREFRPGSRTYAYWYQLFRRDAGGATEVIKVYNFGI